MSKKLLRIRNVKTNLWWSNNLGWADFESATIFQPEEAAAYRLPLDSKWNKQ